MLSKAASSTIFLVFGIIRPGIEPRSPGPLANTLLIRPRAEMAEILGERFYYQGIYVNRMLFKEDEWERR